MTTVRILMLEDVATDAELVEHELRKGKLNFTATLATTEEAFERELVQFEPDLILADYSLPTFDGIEALSIARDRCPHIPFIFVSGAIGEELAIETLKKGATDYVLKQRLSRLVPSVRRALKEAEERASRAHAEEALRQSEERHRVLLEINNAIIAKLDREPLFEAMAGALSSVVALDRVFLTLRDPERDRLRVHALAGAGGEGSAVPIGAEFSYRNGHLVPVFEQGRALVRQDLARERESALEDGLLKDGIRSYVAVPLIVKSQPFGTFNVASLQRHNYSDADADFLMEVGQQVALAVENMLAYEEIGLLKSRLEEENVYLQEEIKTEHNFEEIIGESARLKEALKSVEIVAPTDANVLITGETGTGKELIARAIHNLSRRKDKPLIKVNCASIPKELFESEFFGHIRGAFTGALRDRLGRFELADGGTLFLDEVGEIPLELQSKLLRVLQEGEFERIGEEKTRKVDVRIIAATNRQLEKESRANRFREDLYFRLSVFPIEIPPLRERIEDIPLLADHFAEQACRKLGVADASVSRRDARSLQKYHWPGNVRELQNVMERAVITSRSGSMRFEPPEGGMVDAGPVDEGSSEPRGPATNSVMSYAELKQREYENVRTALQQTNWKVAGTGGAAELLGVKPSTLATRIKALGIQRPG